MPISPQRDLDASCTKVTNRVAGIQPCGCLVVVDHCWHTIHLSSTNLTAFLGRAPEETIGANPYRVLGAAMIDRLTASLSKCPEESLCATTTYQPVPDGSLLLHVTARSMASGIALELEPMRGLPGHLSGFSATWGARIATTDNARETLDTLLRALLTLGGYDYGVIHRYGSDGDLEILQEASHPDSEGGVRHSCPTPTPGSSPGSWDHGGLLGMIADTTAPAVPLVGNGADTLDLTGMVLHAAFPEHQANLLLHDVRACLSILLHNSALPWGRLCCYGRRPRYLAPPLRHLLQLLVHAAMQRYFLLRERHELSRRTRFMDTLGQQRQTSVDTLFSTARSWMRCFQACGIGLTFQGRALGLGQHPPASRLRHISCYLDRHSPDRPWNGHRLRHDERLATLTMPREIAGMLAVPLTTDGQPIGWLMLFRPIDKRGSSAPWTSADQHAAADLGRMLSAAIAVWNARRLNQHLIRHNARLQHLAHTDPVTLIANRHRIGQLLDAERLAAEHGAPPYSVLLFDIDHFKKINDTHGHNAGDEVLRRIAYEVQAHLRAGDHIGRWGGEEFVIIAPSCGAVSATELANRLCREIPRLDIPPAGKVSISIGVTTWAEGDTTQRLIHRADQAMYRAKQAGRACVQVASPDP